jgi:uncharacterized protein
MTHFLIVPGYGDSAPEHWQTYFERALPKSRRVRQESWNRPLMQDWVNALHAALMQHDPLTAIVITQSLGGIALAHWAQQHSVMIKGAMIVAPPDLEFPYQDLSLQSFTPIPTAKFPFRSIVVGSTNDPWATQARTKLFADNWGSELIFVGDAGHINVDSGHTRWQEGLQILRKLDPTLSNIVL